MSATVLAVLISSLLSPRPAAAGGVTVITHGFDANIDAWITSMAERHTGYPGFPGSTSACYALRVTATDTVLEFIGGTAPDQTDSGEIFIKLDWSTVSAGGYSTIFVAERAAQALLAEGLIAELPGAALAELPLHLAGHSRGASVVAEMARVLGASGAWVDHVTFWDPVPLGSAGDPAVTTYGNVLFADNYYQTIFSPTGTAIPGAYDRKLTNLSGGYSGPGGPHSDVHLWYHGTVELTTPATDTLATITASERANWWTAAENEGAAAGHHYSLIGGGDRLSDLEPAGPGNGRISDGFNRIWDLGGGTSPGSRTALPVNSGQWPNLIRCALETTAPAAAGGVFDLSFYHQSGAAASGQVTLKVYLDADNNPWNGAGIEVDQRLLDNTGTAAVGFTSISVQTDPATVAPGDYAVCLEISDGTRRRFLYTPELLEVAPSEAPPVIDYASFTVTAAAASFDLIAYPGQTVRVRGSDNLVNWTTLETRTFDDEVWAFVDDDRPSFDQRFYKAELAP